MPLSVDRLGVLLCNGVSHSVTTENMDPPVALCLSSSSNSSCCCCSRLLCSSSRRVRSRSRSRSLAYSRCLSSSFSRSSCAISSSLSRSLFSNSSFCQAFRNTCGHGKGNTICIRYIIIIIFC